MLEFAEGLACVVMGRTLRLVGRTALKLRSTELAARSRASTKLKAQACALQNLSR
jgi:hypothetical protein